jgi:hypothetical protein
VSSIFAVTGWLSSVRNIASIIALPIGPDAKLRVRLANVVVR